MTGPRPYMTSEFTQIMSPISSHLGFLYPDVESPSDSGVPSAPWMKSPVYEQSLTGLHDELVDLADWLQPTYEEKLMRQIAFDRAKAYLFNIYPNSVVDLYGSVATGVYLSDSDVDVSVRFKGRTEVDYYRVAEYFRQNGSYRDIHVRVKSSIPLVKLVDGISNFSMDITFNMASNSAAEWVKRQMAIYPDLDRLILIVKKMMVVYHLNEPFSGGLSSYALVILLTHYLNYNSHFYQRHKPLGLILMKFLCFYGEEFDYLNKAVMFDGNQAVFIDKVVLQQQNEAFVGSSMLTIIDPVDPMNDVGRGAHRMVVVRSTFLMLKRILLLSLHEKSVVHHGSVMSLVIPIASAELATRRGVVRAFRHLQNLTANPHCVDSSQLVPFLMNYIPNWVVQYPCAFTLPLGFQIPYYTSNKLGEAVYTTAGSPPVVNPLPSQYSLAEPMVSSSVASSTLPSISNGEMVNSFMPPITFNAFRPSITMPNRLMLNYIPMANAGIQPGIPFQNGNLPDAPPQNMSRTSDSSEDSAVEVDQPLYNWEKERVPKNSSNNLTPEDGVSDVSEEMSNVSLSEKKGGHGGPKLNMRKNKLYG
ncbi:unnamed protein product [Bursaphelenchus xylophilus]|uniref:(pine wood nematode) hypothetical protein n=1 Tax=Bursaphelenchus xylophilus TaxID=6326 RepID=A0A1I7S780_BURXY|nr:unnamed protein product [Bursaphelenchus xylophilus]CAG9084729.1 unnamed protein product [Bursaphelenchus xylophilus]